MRQTGKCFEDFAIGDVLILGETAVTREEIVAFAQEFDPVPMHLADPVAGSAFSAVPELAEPGAPPAEAIVAVEGIVASVWHLGSLFMRVFYDGLLDGSSSRGAPGIEALTWPHPVRPGDTIRFTLEVMDVRPSRSRPDLGLVLFDMIGVNQRGETVITTRSWSMFGRKEAARAEVRDAVV